MPLRFLRLKHNNVRQNITYSCDSGVDSFMLVQLLAANGDTLTFSDKTIRMISQVRSREVRELPPFLIVGGKRVINLLFLVLLS